MPAPPPYASRPDSSQAPLPALKTVLLTQSGMAILALFVLTGITALAIDIFGNPKAASPSVKIALFADKKSVARPALKRRLADEAHSRPDPDHQSEPKKAHRITITHDDKASDIPSHSGTNALPAAPIPAVHKTGSFGHLPGIARDGRRPAEVYARHYTTTSNAKIAIILGGLGQNTRLTEQAINELPPEITLSFVPYARGLQSWIDKARAAGHEILLEIPMEPYDYPNNDPGPHTLLIGNNVRENKRRLTYLLSRAAGYFGLINYQGEKFVTSARSLSPLLKEVGQHGLAFIHDGAAPRSEFPALADRAKINFAIADRIIDAQPNTKTINEQFLQLEALALENGQALGAGFAYPVTLDQLSEWTERIPERGFDLVPASALAGIRAADNPS